MKFIRNKELLKKGAAYSLAGFGQNLIGGLVSGYIMLFFTDAFGISAVSAGFIMFASRIIDIFSDPILGKIIDKTSSKNFSLRRYLILAPWFLGFITVACFYSPNISENGKTIYAGAALFIWGIAFTLLDVPYWGISNSLSDNAHERDCLLTAGKMFSVAGSGLLTIVVPLITGAVAKSVQNSMTGDMLLTDIYSETLQSALKTAFLKIAVFCSAVGAPVAAIGAAFLKVKKVVGKRRENGTSISFFQNRRLVLLAVSFVLGSLQGVYGFMYPYLSKYTLSEYTFSTDSWASLMSALSVPLGLVGSLAVPFLCKKYSRNNLFLACQLFSAVLLISMYFIGFGSSFAVVLQGLGLFVLGFPSGVRNVLGYSMIGETAEIYKNKTGIRSEGVSFSVQTFVTKFSTALCQLAVGLCLSFSSYSPNVYLPDNKVKNSLFTLASLGAGISSLLSAVPILIFHFKRNNDQTDAAAD